MQRIAEGMARLPEQAQQRIIDAMLLLMDVQDTLNSSDTTQEDVLPEPEKWQQPPAHGHIGISAYVVRREIWKQHAWAWVPGVYYSDFKFITAIFAADPVIYWHNVVASRVQQIGLGRPE